MATIEGFRVSNFKVLRDVTLGRLWNQQGRAPLTRMSAVIGKNGVGKSALFDAFGFLADALRMGVEDACDARGRGGFARLRTQGTNGPIAFELCYRQRPAHRPITYELEIAQDPAERRRRNVYRAAGERRSGRQQYDRRRSAARQPVVQRLSGPQVTAMHYEILVEDRSGTACGRRVSRRRRVSQTIRMAGGRKGEGSMGGAHSRAHGRGEQRVAELPVLPGADSRADAVAGRRTADLQETALSSDGPARGCGLAAVRGIMGENLLRLFTAVWR